MKVLGVIPSRYGSTRFPGKPLVDIAGRSLLGRVIDGAKTSKGLSQLIVATDDVRIAEEASRCGVEAVMTSSDLPTGTDRIYEASKEMDADIVLNIQGDEPLLQGAWLDLLIDPFKDDNIQMATLGRPIRSLEDVQSPNTAKIVIDEESNAIYFSRLPVPYSRENLTSESDLTQSIIYKHIGIYAYRSDFLRSFCEKGPCELEKLEGLEQLRALYMGAKIRVVELDAESWGVDTPSDVVKIEELLKQK